MLVKSVDYGVWSSRTGLTVNVFGSLAAASRVSAGGDADRVSWVMSSSRTVSRGTVVSCQPNRLSKCRFWNCWPTSSTATYCVRFVPTPAGQRRLPPPVRESVRRGHTPRARRATRDPGCSESSPRGPPTAPPRRSWLLLAVSSVSGSYVPKPSSIGGCDAPPPPLAGATDVPLRSRRYSDRPPNIRLNMEDGP